MLKKEQTDAAAEAMLAPGRAAQAATQMRMEKQRRKRVAQQRFAWSGLVGLGMGAAIGYLLIGRVIPAALAGMGLGFIVGQFVSRRAV